MALLALLTTAGAQEPAAKAPSSHVTINSLPGARIYLNGTLVDTTTYSADLTPGTHIFEARLASHKSIKCTMEILPDKPEVINLNPIPVYGSLSVTSNPADAAITIDGKYYGQTPATIENLLIGQYRACLTKEGCHATTDIVTIEEGKTAQLGKKLISGEEADFASDPMHESDDHPSDLVFSINGIEFTMVRVAGGTFTMGATAEQSADAFNNETPAHQVTLSDFSIGQTEVTQGLWKAVMGGNPSYYKGDNLPVEHVSWDNCQMFIRRLNQLTGRNFRLPTEAEWEYAARGGKQSHGYKYAGSDNLTAVAWHTDNSSRKTHLVAAKQANELGLYDMSGNVYEWCQDWYGDYAAAPQTDPRGPTKGSFHVLRGGCWCDSDKLCRVAYRWDIDLESSGIVISYGFRLVLP